jgi:hypothetical protein
MDAKRKSDGTFLNYAGPGRPGIPASIRQAIKHDKISVILILNELLDMGKHALQERLADPNTGALELMIGGIIVKAIQDGDQNRLTFLLGILSIQLNEQTKPDENEIGKVLDLIPREKVIALIDPLSKDSENK